MVNPASSDLTIAPATPERWPELEGLLEPANGCAGCWCRWWQQTSAAYRAHLGAHNRRQLRDEVTGAATPPGLIAYVGGTPAGWCRTGPRASYPRLARSRTLKPVDDQPVWSVVCFYVAPAARGTGVARALCEAAAEFASHHGAPILEAYPVAAERRVPSTEAYTGTTRLMAGLGFAPVRQGGGRREIWRRALGPSSGR